MTRPSALGRFVALAAGSLIIAGCQSGGGAGSASTSASAGASQVSVQAPTSLIKAGTLTDCVDIEYPPMEYFPSTSETDPNKAIGFDVDGARAVAKAFGLQLDVRNVAFNGLIPDLTTGRCDIVWTALYITTARTAKADAVPYMATSWDLMVPTDNPKNIASPDDLCGKTISIQTGGQVEIESKAQSKKCTDAGKQAINIQGYPKVADELQQIVVGRVDAVWETDSAISDFLLKHPNQYKVAYAFPKSDTYGIYFQKNKPDLKTALTAALKAVKDAGSLANLCKQYQIDPVVLDAIK